MSAALSRASWNPNLSVFALPPIPWAIWIGNPVWAAFGILVIRMFAWVSKSLRPIGIPSVIGWLDWQDRWTIRIERRSTAQAHRRTGCKPGQPGHLAVKPGYEGNEVKQPLRIHPHQRARPCVAVDARPVHEAQRVGLGVAAGGGIVEAVPVIGEARLDVAGASSFRPP
jgi:hypothetical protein